MRPTRRGPALVTAALIATMLAGCTSGTVVAPAPRSPPRQPGPPLNLCWTAGWAPLSNGVDQLQVVLGVVALPISPRYPALGTALSGDGSGPLRLFAKTGLFFRPGTTFELIVPARFASRLRIGWGNPGTPSQTVGISNCASPGGGGWLAIAGGYWIDHPACVPIIVRAGGRQQQVHIGVGTACPGQRPPQGPSQS